MRETMQIEQREKSRSPFLLDEEELETFLGYRTGLPLRRNMEGEDILSDNYEVNLNELFSGQDDSEVLEGEFNNDPEEEFNFWEFPLQIVDKIKKGFEKLAIQLAINFGFTDENKLTNLVFFVKHPELNNQKLEPSQPNFKSLSNEWKKIRDNLVRPLLGKQIGQIGREIQQIINNNRVVFGVTKELERQAAKRYHGPQATELNVIKLANIAKFIPFLEQKTNHIIFSRSLFQKTSLRNYLSGEDMPLVIAIGTREAGQNIFRNDETPVVSGGTDTHPAGVSGLDNLSNYGPMYFKEAGGLFIKNVKKEELKKKKRNPAWIKAKHLMFAHMITNAHLERDFRKYAVPRTIEELGIKSDSHSLLENLNTNARRAWVALNFSGQGYMRAALSELLTNQVRQNTRINLNGIMNFSIGNPKLRSKVVLARATALRTFINEQLK